MTYVDSPLAKSPPPSPKDKIIISPSLISMTLSSESFLIQDDLTRHPFFLTFNQPFPSPMFNLTCYHQNLRKKDFLNIIFRFLCFLTSLLFSSENNLLPTHNHQFKKLTYLFLTY